MSIICLKNDSLTVKIKTLGAELNSILDANGGERLWQGDPAFWHDQAPVLFPVAGGFRDDEYILNGKAYHMPKHGFAKKREFAVEEQSNTSATFLLAGEAAKDDGFPFDYELRVRYTLDGAAIKVDYIVTNLQDTPLYCSVGAHEGYACEGGIENYEIKFDKPEGSVLKSNILLGNLLSHETRDLPLNNRNALELKYDYFAVDAQVFLTLKSRSVTLCRKGGEALARVDFKGLDYMLIWTRPNAPYICIEPWANHPDFVDWCKQLPAMPGVLAIAAHDSAVRTHTITIL